ncbi:predicted protein, partial [Nematostella vectensis]
MYSSGMFARLAFAVAINVEPDILIVDEALSVGDAAFQAKCFNKFKELREQGVTILFVTHSTDLVIKYCQTAILLNEGVKLKNGECKETIEEYRKLIVNTARKDTELIEKKQIKDTSSKTSFYNNLKEKLNLNPNPVIYGTLEAEIIDFGIINNEGIVTHQIYHNEEYILQLTVKFNEAIIDPIFAYSIKSVEGLELTDGDVEDKILEIVKSHDDFTDVLQEINNWAVMYHLTPMRLNLLEWYEFDRNKTLLEIGGGCGAFTGMFAEKLEQVKVVELSRRRSEIIYQRHNKYDNLEILVGNLNDMEIKQQFDYVTLIGVLEYAGKFTE